ncbi:MAG: ABC transporter permease [Clostridiales bacterium]|nr:ABC transporter permease [Clostridiales bacterium]MDY5515407.1 ABC transporter permease [Candidatus Ventricola sp.]
MVKNTLRKKLYRDMSRAAMQFLSIIALCALGTFAFAALDGTARMTRTTLDTYYEENNLADFWVTLPAGVDRTSLDKVSGVDGIAAVRARASADLETTLEGDASVSVTAYDGEMDINAPLLREGELLDIADKRGCLVEERFAQAHGLSLGDRITVKLSGQEYTFLIRGIAVSPEYIVVSDGIVADPNAYGYILINSCAMRELPLTQIVAMLEEGADSDTVRAAIEEALPDALVVDRTSHSSTARANNDAQMFENMTLIFPILAYAVAALIVMTTLSRMIDNQRLQMGTLSALGFSARQIKNHYLSYAVAPSLIGAVLGTLIGHYTLPFFLWDALIGQNEMPYQLVPPISVPAWIMTALSVIMSVCIMLFSYHKAAQETTAALLRPKPPKDGKRILLERMTFLWSRFSFNAKMITRNLMRNKLRTLMSLVGLLCCNMLIITSLGLQDSVTAMSVNYYTGTLAYDVRANLKGEVGTAESYERRLEADTVECVMEQSISLRADGGTRTVMMTVLEDDQTLQHLGEHETFVSIQPGTAAVTYKLTKTLGISLGDTIRLYLPGDDEPLTMVVGQIVSNNVSQGVYLNRSTWEAQRKGDFTPTAIQLLGPSESCLSLLADMDEVDSIDYPAEQIQDMLWMLDTLSSVFTLLTGIALALAFVICYNMGLMNFVERTREYATLKVLGYHQKEIRKLILRENNIISTLGVLLGVAPGILLTDVILHSCEPESGYYPGAPTLQSVLIACAITFCFSYLLQLLLTRKVKKIDMVEALKSVE